MPLELVFENNHILKCQLIKKNCEATLTTVSQKLFDQINLNIRCFPFHCELSAARR